MISFHSCIFYNKSRMLIATASKINWFTTQTASIFNDLPSRFWLRTGVSWSGSRRWQSAPRQAEAAVRVESSVDDRKPSRSWTKSRWTLSLSLDTPAPMRQKRVAWSIVSLLEKSKSHTQNPENGCLSKCTTWVPLFNKGFARVGLKVNKYKLTNLSDVSSVALIAVCSSRKSGSTLEWIAISFPSASADRKRTPRFGSLSAFMNVVCSCGRNGFNIGPHWNARKTVLVHRNMHLKAEQPRIEVRYENVCKTDVPAVAENWHKKNLTRFVGYWRNWTRKKKPEVTI